MPNQISVAELEDMRVDDLGRRLKFVRAGQICMTAGGASCAAVLDQITACVLYAEIVEGRVMKFGTTDSLVSRQSRNVQTINSILAFQDGRSRSVNRKITDPTTYDKYKRQAPVVIRGGKPIEIWATSLAPRATCQDSSGRSNGQCAACCPVQSARHWRR